MFESPVKDGITNSHVSNFESPVNTFGSLIINIFSHEKSYHPCFLYIFTFKVMFLAVLDLRLDLSGVSSFKL